MNDAGHRTGANCGEPMAGLAFVQTNSGAPLDGAKVVTWGKYKVKGKSGSVTGGWRISMYGGAISWLTANFTVFSSGVKLVCDTGRYGIGGYGAESQPTYQLSVFQLTVRLRIWALRGHGVWSCYPFAHM